MLVKLPILVSTCKAHKPRGNNTRHTMYYTRLYISGQIQKISIFSSSALLYIFWSFYLKKKLKNCKAPQFCKISFIVVIVDRFLFQRRFLQGLQWVLMGFSVYSARFLIGSSSSYRSNGKEIHLHLYGT